MPSILTQGYLLIVTTWTVTRPCDRKKEGTVVNIHWTLNISLITSVAIADFMAIPHFKWV